MPYFNLMSAINLYVAVDWQGDKEIERARSEEREEKRVEMTRGRREKLGKERNPELRQTERKEEKSDISGEEERKSIHKRDRYPVFINRNSI